MRPEELPLRDIHLPPDPGWWPPAPGWWLVAGSALGVLAALGLWRWYRRRPLSVRRAAEQELARIRSAYEASDDGMQLVRDLSVLLRRVVLSVKPRAEVAGVQGEAWLVVLDELSGTREFTQGAGQVFAAAPYQRAATIDAYAVLALCERLVRRKPARAAAGTAPLRTGTPQDPRAALTGT